MKKMVSLLLCLLMIFAIGTATAEDKVLTVKRGDEVSVDISISSASGSSAKIGIDIGDAPVTFKSAVGGTANDTVPPKAFNDFFVVVNLDGMNLKPDGSDFTGNLSDYDVIDLVDGKIGTLTFTVNSDAEPGTYTVQTFKKSGSVTVSGSVEFTIEKAVVGDRLPGDANGDGIVDMDDALAIMQWISGFPGVTINEANANCDGDSEVTMDDALAIMQWISGFPGVVLK